MIGHYLAMAFAKIRKTPFTTLANILTLAMGLACFIAAWGIATWWQSGDTYHRNAGRTAIIGAIFKPVGGEDTPLNMRTPAPIGPLLRQDFPEFERVSRSLTEEDISVSAGPNKLLLNIAMADPDFLKIFDFTYVAGDATALDKPGSVVLTEETAMRLFPDGQAMGRTVRIGKNRDVQVTAVIKGVRQPSFMGASRDAELKFDLIGDWATSPGGIERDTRVFWVGNNTYTIGLLKPGASLAAVQGRLDAFIKTRMPTDAQKMMELNLKAFPISEVSTRRLDTMMFSENKMGLTAVSVLLGLGVLTLVVACINYASLATAQAAGRAKEFGMRRVMGAGGGLVMVQAWLEALLLTLLALTLAIGILALASPVIQSTLGVDIIYFLASGPKAWGVIAAIVAAVTLVAGAYPALALSRIQPADALRSGKSRSGPGFVARILVGAQFASASFLIILVTVAQQQRLYLEEIANTSHGDPVIALNDLKPMGLAFATVESELKAIPGVKSVTFSDRLPWTSRASVMNFVRQPDADPATAPAGFLKQVGYDYFETLGIPVIAGRAFDRARETKPSVLMGDNGPDPIPMLVDRSYASALGFDTPQAALGQIVYMPAALMRNFGRPAQPAIIIGVTETDRMRFSSPAITRGHMYMFAAGSPAAGLHIPVLKIDARRFPQTMEVINGIWKRLSPDTPLNVQFLDQLFEQGYRQYARISQMFIALALTAFVIASIGLLGIAVHVAVRRRHEVAVRKTLGSSASRVVSLLLTDFSKPVLIGNVLAWPLAWVAASAYLSAFSNRVDLTVTPFLFSMGLTLVIAWVAVIGVVLRSATLRPAEVLRRA